MRGALRIRDLATVYQRLGRHGFSQRRIAQLTGQSPSEVYEIIKGRRVMAYDLLARIAEGLGIPRGYMGLSYAAEPLSAWEGALVGSVSTTDEMAEVRRLLSQAANIMMGVSVQEASRWWQPCERAITPVPDQVGSVDVTQLEHITGVLRALDYRHGGGSCRDAVVAQADYARMLLTSDSSDEVRHRLRGALADLHNLAGWTSFDVGLFSASRRHFAIALEQAKACDNPSLVANVLYRLGRLHLHQSYTMQALKFFQLGQLAAQDAEDSLTVAMLHANEAWAYAIMGETTKALNSLGRAQDEFVRPRRGGAPGWVSFFGEADLHALMGMVGFAAPIGDRCSHAA
ncbi:helix-turn-helix domain-containing protein [Krasilnikovia sp. M28-CT-15]|uniref:helix-turn-helix domain-containing protein n=1 Tax=Krasilnikovia sp. M28-CT-15 TaxID=3373540 RepID=UPI00399CA3FF